METLAWFSLGPLPDAGPTCGAPCPAWRIAVEAGARWKVSGMGKLLLGMDAHVKPRPTLRPGLDRPHFFARASVAQLVEEAAAVNARAIVTATGYLSPLTSTAPGTSTASNIRTRAAELSSTMWVGGRSRPLGPR